MVQIKLFDALDLRFVEGHLADALTTESWRLAPPNEWRADFEAWTYVFQVTADEAPRRLTVLEDDALSLRITGLANLADDWRALTGQLLDALVMSILDGNDVVIGSKGDDGLIGLTGNDELRGRAGDDLLFGGAGRDTLGGGTGDDLLRGGAGADRLFGWDDADTIHGGAGRDRIVGGTGADEMTGGGLRDVFVFAEGDMPTEGAADRITDFTPSLDRIDLRQIDADPDTPGNQALEFMGNGVPLVDPGPGVIYFDGGLLQGAAIDGAPRVRLLLDGVEGLSPEDFIL